MTRSGRGLRWVLATTVVGAVLGQTHAQVTSRRAPSPSGPYPAGSRQPAAAATAERPGRATVVIRRMPRLTRNTLYQRTPEFQGTASKAVRRPREWAMFDLTYDTTAEFTDELVFNYYVLCLRTIEGKKEFSLFQTTVRYTDILRGEHQACAVLAPGALLRYGEPVAFAVEIAGADGAALVSDTTVENRSALPADVQADWWKNPRVMENPSVTKRESYLTDRSKTPFALINADDYEAVK